MAIKPENPSSFSKEGGKGRGGGKRREGKGMEEKGREEKGSEGKGRGGKGRGGKGREGKGRERGNVTRPYSYHLCWYSVLHMGSWCPWTWVELVYEQTREVVVSH